MPLIKGTDLSPSQRRQVLESFSYRWTSDNPQRIAAWNVTKLKHPTIPLISDEAWLARYSFYFTGAGQLSRRKTYAEPILPPPPAPILGSAKAGDYVKRCLLEV